MTISCKSTKLYWINFKNSMKILFKFCFTCIFGLMVWRRGATTRLLEWREREKKKLHWTSDHQILISIGRNEKSAVGWKGHWRDPIWISRESPWIRLYSVHLQVSTGVPATRCSFLSSPMPIHRKANVEKSTASMCNVWRLAPVDPSIF